MNYRVINGLTALAGKSDHLFINYDRQVHYDGIYSIHVEKFISLYNYVNDFKKEKIDPGAHDIAILKVSNILKSETI